MFCNRNRTQALAIKLVNASPVLEQHHGFGTYLKHVIVDWMAFPLWGKSRNVTDNSPTRLGALSRLNSAHMELGGHGGILVWRGIGS